MPAADISRPPTSAAFSKMATDGGPATLAGKMDGKPTDPPPTARLTSAAPPMPAPMMARSKTGLNRSEAFAPCCHADGGSTSAQLYGSEKMAPSCDEATPLAVEQVPNSLRARVCGTPTTAALRVSAVRCGARAGVRGRAAAHLYGMAPSKSPPQTCAALESSSGVCAPAGGARSRTAAAAPSASMPFAPVVIIVYREGA